MKNDYEIRGDVTAIFIDSPKYGELETLIDTEDLDKAIAYPNSWIANHARNTGTFYVVGEVRRGDEHRKKIILHRLIMCSPSYDFVIDHINHDTLDNRKANLRILTNAENFQNPSGPYKNSKSGIRGVCWHKASGKWYASIKINGKCKYLGIFDDIKEAEKVAKEARRKLMPFYVEEDLKNGN